MAAWHGRQCGSPNATFAGIGGYQTMSNPRIVRRRTADLCCGIRVVLTAGREKHESRQVGAAGTQRRTDDSQWFLPQQPQVDESIAREIRVLGGHAGIPSETTDDEYQRSKQPWRSGHQRRPDWQGIHRRRSGRAQVPSLLSVTCTP